MRQMTLVAFLQAQNCTNFVGSWRHPEASPGFMTADYYRHIARVLEAGKFHVGFFDDRLAMPDRYRRRSRAYRRQRHPLREDGPDHHPHRDGHGDRTAGSRRHLLHHLLRAVPRRARVPDARPDDQRPRRLEHRHVDERRRGAEHGPRRAWRARSSATTAPTNSWKSSSATGTPGTTTRSCSTSAPACSRIPTRCGGSIMPANTSARADRSPCRVRRRAIRC